MQTAQSAQITEIEQSYLVLQSKIKLLLARAMETRKIAIEELMAILFILGQTTTTLELEAFVEIFSDTFPVLKTVQLERSEREKINIQDKVKRVISALVLTDPLRAAQLAKDALKKDADMAKLLEKYPELGE